MGTAVALVMVQQGRPQAGAWAPPPTPRLAHSAGMASASLAQPRAALQTRRLQPPLRHIAQAAHRRLPPAQAADMADAAGDLLRLLVDTTAGRAAVAAVSAYSVTTATTVMVAMKVAELGKGVGKLKEDQDEKFKELLQTLDKRLDEQNKRFDERFDQQNKRFDEQNKRLDEQNNKLDALHQCFSELDKRVASMDGFVRGTLYGAEQTQRNIPPLWPRSSSTQQVRAAWMLAAACNMFLPCGGGSLH